MTVNDALSMISTVGFPIAACICMFWVNSQMQKTLAEHAVIMQKVADRLDCIERELEKIREKGGEK